MPVLAFHLLFTGYGHWLPNDPRGSGSRDVRQEILQALGPSHLGRKRQQPSRDILKSFYRSATPLLKYQPLWFTPDHRSLIGNAIARTIIARNYTCWACAVLSNHVHLCVRRHKDSDETIWMELARSTALSLRTLRDVPNDHRIWADRPYAVFLESPSDIRRVVGYIEGNPMKEGLPRQGLAFCASL